MFSVFGYPNYSTVQTTFGKFLKLVGGTNVGLLGYSIEPSSALSAKAGAVSAQLAGLKVGYLNSNLPFGSTNITPEVLAMKAGGVDAFEAETDPSTALAGIEGLRQQGVQLKAPIMPETSGDLQVAGAATLSQATGVYLLSSYEPAEMHTAATQALQRALKSYAGVTTDPTFDEYLGYIEIDALVQGLKAAGTKPSSAGFIRAMLGITHYDAAGLWGAHSITFAMADRGKGTAGADNCEWYTKWDGKAFDLVAHADPICGQTVPGKTVSTGS